MIWKLYGCFRLQWISKSVRWWKRAHARARESRSILNFDRKKYIKTRLQLKQHYIRRNTLISPGVSITSDRPTQFKFSLNSSEFTIYTGCVDGFCLLSIGHNRKCRTLLYEMYMIHTHTCRHTPTRTYACSERDLYNHSITLLRTLLLLLSFFWCLYTISVYFRWFLFFPLFVCIVWRVEKPV